MNDIWNMTSLLFKKKKKKTLNILKLDYYTIFF